MGLSASKRFKRKFRDRRTRSVSATKQRPLHLELLECRRLLVAPGESIVVNEPIDTAGLLGDVSAEIRWGDGQTSPATVTPAASPTGSVQIRFDYTYDTGFFSGSNSHRRDLLRIAADSLTSRFTDQLDAITPTANITWDVSIINPSTDTPVQLSPRPVIAANEIVVYAGARALPGEARGAGGVNFDSIATVYTGPDPCDTQAQCQAIQAEIDQFQDSINTRGQAGVEGPAPYDYAPFIGTITFDDDDTIWYDTLDPSGFDATLETDLLTVATHELAHVLGFGTSQSWTELSNPSKTLFEGADSIRIYDRLVDVPIDGFACEDADGNETVCGGSHWSEDVLDDHPTILTNRLRFTSGQRDLLSPLDFAALNDLGWSLNDVTKTISATHQYSGLGTYTPELVMTGSRAGELVVDLAEVNVVPDGPATLNAEFTPAEIGEDSSTGATLTVRRENAYINAALPVSINTNSPGQLAMPATITIEAGKSERVIQVLPVNDPNPEPAATLAYTFAASGFQVASAQIRLLDDEPPLFQNPLDRYDVSGTGGVTASDALRIINALTGRLSADLDPETEQPNGVYYDVNGDYQLTALDALIVINQLARQSAGEAEPTTVSEGVIEALAHGILDTSKDPLGLRAVQLSERGELF